MFKHFLIQKLIFGGWSYRNARFRAPREASNGDFKLKMTPLGSLKTAFSLGPSFKNLLSSCGHLLKHIFVQKSVFERWSQQNAWFLNLRRASEGDFKMKVKPFGSSKVASAWTILQKSTFQAMEIYLHIFSFKN